MDSCCRVGLRSFVFVILNRGTGNGTYCLEYGEMIYRNKKNGKRYKRIAIGVDTTNCRDGINVIVYCPYENEHLIYVREQGEFDEKFEVENVLG